MPQAIRSGAVLLLTLTFLWAAASAQQTTLPKPPRFTLNDKPERVLANYPLGVIDRNAAFSHHGKAHQQFTLPNQREGWLYDVGEKEWHRTYTLVFGKDGKVIDVMFFDHGRHEKYGLTALQVQSKAPRTQQPSIAPGPE
ncbi:MAG TPA: hypothetical protein VKA64_04200 [Gammaproteobacteria bacterium]|nr:hypothetical protein [Gammaproteobacteria bacterium]